MSFPTASSPSSALDVLPNVSPEETLAAARIMLEQICSARRVTRCWCWPTCSAPRPATWRRSWSTALDSRLVAGVNLPMLLRAVSYRHEPLETLVQRAIAGGTAGVMQVAVAAPQNQARRKHSDQDIRDHQQ